MSDLRIGLVVPGCSTALEVELPEMLARRAAIGGDTFTFQTCRQRLASLTPAPVDRIIAEAERCARELGEAGVDVIVYGCPASLMAQRVNYANEVEKRLAAAAARGHHTPVVVNSANALIEGVRALGAERIALLSSYETSVSDLMVASIEEDGIEVVDVISVDAADNVSVDRIEAMSLLAHLDDLLVISADAVVLAACVQCPTLPAVTIAQSRVGRPVLSASIATAFGILTSFGLDTAVPRAGALLDGTRQLHR